MASSLEHAQEIATSRKNEVDELERKLQDSDLEKERMNGVRNEVSFIFIPMIFMCLSVMY